MPRTSGMRIFDSWRSLRDPSLSEEFVACIGSVDLHMTDRAVAVTRVGKIVRHLSPGGRILARNRSNVAVTLNTKLRNAIALEQLWISGTVRVMTSGTSFDLKRRVFEDERALFVRMTLVADSIRSGCQPRLLLLKPTVRIMAVAAIHRAFQHPVMKWSVELRLRLVMTCHAEQNLVPL